MNKRTLNLVTTNENEQENTLVEQLVSQVIDTVNEAICFYSKRESQAMFMYLEDTIINLKPFAEIIAKQDKLGQALLERLTVELNKVQKGIAPTKITLNEMTFMAATSSSNGAA